MMMLLKLEILKFLKNNFVYYLGLTLFPTAESFFISILTDFLGVTYREREKDLVLIIGKRGGAPLW